MQHPGRTGVLNSRDSMSGKTRAHHRRWTGLRKKPISDEHNER
jgi:hypothetical protein